MLNLSENLPRKKKFNPYKPLLVIADRPGLSSYIGLWVLTVVAFLVGLPLNSGFLVGGAMMLASPLAALGIAWGGIMILKWADDGGWRRVRRNLQEKAERHGRIED